MKAIVQNTRGEPADVLALAEIEDAAPGPGEVSIDVTLAPVHHGDLHLIRSGSGIAASGAPVRRGLEAVGVVRALGSGVRHLAVGDRVIAFPAAGAWAQSVVVPASAVFPVPAEVDDAIAAQLLINFVTARMVLRALRKSAPDTVLREGAVLVTGAGTAVARLLLHLLRQDGFTPIGLTRSTASAARLAERLDVSVAATDEAGWQASVASLAAGWMIVAALDCVSGLLLADIAPLLADDAVIVSYGALDSHGFGIGAPEVVNRQFMIRGVVFTRWWSDLSPEEQADDIRSAFAVAASVPALFGTAAIHDLADFREAVRAVETAGRDGFVFVRP